MIALQPVLANILFQEDTCIHLEQSTIKNQTYIYIYINKEYYTSSPV